MKLFNGHVDFTAKSLATGSTAIVGFLVAFSLTTPERAAAIGALLSFIASAVVPDREAGLSEATSTPPATVASSVAGKPEGSLTKIGGSVVDTVPPPVESDPENP